MNIEWFKFRASWWYAIKDMSEKEAGIFVKAICDYAFEDHEEYSNGREMFTVKGAIGQIKRDFSTSATLNSYQPYETEIETEEDKKARISQARREAGKKGAQAKLANQANLANSGKTKQILANVANSGKSWQNQANQANLPPYIERDKEREIEREKDISSSSCSNDAHAREDTGAFTGFGAAYSDVELAAMQKQRMEDVPAIERLMRECGYAFSPADETIAIELLNSGETTDGILDAIRIAKESNALNWRYIKGVLKKQKEGSYGTGTGNRRTGTASAGTGSTGAGGGRSQGKGTEDTEDDFDRYLKSCVI